MANRFRMHFAPLGERTELAFVSLDFCDAILRIYWEEGALSPEQLRSMQMVRNEAFDTLREAGYPIH